MTKEELVNHLRDIITEQEYGLLPLEIALDKYAEALLFEIQPLEQLIKEAGNNLRSISFHTDGRVIAKTGNYAPKPKKLYTGKTASEAVIKLIKDNLIDSEK